MARFWLHNNMASAGRWEASEFAPGGCVVEINPDGAQLRPLPKFGVQSAECGIRTAGGSPDMMIMPTGGDTGRPRWIMLAGRRIAVRVNGQPLALGIRALRDKDEIVAGGHRLFFSTEELARVTPFPGMERSVFCPRCKQKLEPGDPAVCCPLCRAWSHQSEILPCWQYAPTCALCQQQSTALDAEFNFNPANL